MSGDQEEQRRITRLALDAVGDDAGFALAGSGAIREHGLIDRPTEDVDLFTVEQAPARFGTSLDRIVAALRTAGYTVEIRRQQDMFAQLTVISVQGRITDMDLGVDWRAHPPVWMDVGPVLSIEDAVGNKVGALFSRAETRDYLDVDAIRRSGLYSDDELLDLARVADAGFDLKWFAQSLENAERIQLEEVLIYGLTAVELDDVKKRCTQWAALLRGQCERSEAELFHRSETQNSPLSASYPKSATEATRQQPGGGAQVRNSGPNMLGQDSRTELDR